MNWDKPVTTTSPEAEALVRDILHASGSSLDFFSREKTRRAMLEAADKHIDAARKAVLETYDKFVRVLP